MIKQDDKETPDAYAGPLTKGDHDGKTLKPELKIDVPVQEKEIVEKTLVQTAETNTFAASEPNQKALFVDQNYALALMIEKSAQDLKEHYTYNEFHNEEQGGSREFALKEEVLGKEVIEEKPNEANTSVPAGPATEIFAVSPVPAEGQPFMAVVLVDNGNILLGPVKIDATKPMPLSYPPALGQYNYETWGKIGLSCAEIDDLKKEGVIYVMRQTGGQSRSPIWNVAALNCALRSSRT